MVFDKGLGDLFVVRVAGNVVDDAITGSLEYAVEHLGVRLVIVLGHSKCGAVQATIAGGEPHAHIEALLKAIRPAVLLASHSKGELLDNAVHENVRMAVGLLKASQPILDKMQAEGKIEVVGAVYDLESGNVEFLQ
jgi:carbonic anhydrase